MPESRLDYKCLVGEAPCLVSTPVLFQFHVVALADTAHPKWHMGDILSHGMLLSTEQSNYLPRLIMLPLEMSGFVTWKPFPRAALC